MATAVDCRPAVREAMVIDLPPQPVQPHWFERYVQPCVAELLGTTFLVFIGCLSDIYNTVGTGMLQPALANGLALGISIAVLGAISGGHFNPTVTLAASLVSGLDGRMVPSYWLSQLCGAMVGAGMAKGVARKDYFEYTKGGAFRTVSSFEQIPSALGSEIILTTILVLVVCMGAINRKTKTLLAPFCIGLTFTINILAGFATSGGCMNPARAFGPAVAANYWVYIWIYWTGPIIGAFIASFLVKFLLGDQTTRLFLK